MKTKKLPALTIAATTLIVVAIAGIAFAKQDRFTLKSPNGIAFSEFKGYDAWQNVAVSRTEDGIKAILGNEAAIDAYEAGIPANGKPFPDGATMVKIEWTKKVNPVSPESVEVPDTLTSSSFISKDSKRFTDTNGWGYALFTYDKATGSFKSTGDDPSFAKKLCHQCHSS